MSTFYQRLTRYCNHKNLEIPSKEEREELGKSIAHNYVNNSDIKRPLFKTISYEPEGDFVVLEYPRLYNPEIDRQIAEYYLQNTPKKRKRIPLKYKSL